MITIYSCSIVYLGKRPVSNVSKLDSVIVTLGEIVWNDIPDGGIGGKSYDTSCCRWFEVPVIGLDDVSDEENFILSAASWN